MFEEMHFFLFFLTQNPSIRYSVLNFNEKAKMSLLETGWMVDKLRPVSSLLNRSSKFLKGIQIDLLEGLVKG